MSKELEALERLYCHLPQIDGDRFKRDKDIIETALNDNYFYFYMIAKICKYLSIDINSHRDLVETENEILHTLLDNEDKLKAFNTLSKENEKIMKELSLEIEKNRAFEIIKNKRVNVRFLISCKTLKEYNDVISDYLTQEEYDLCKEVLL